MSNYSWGQKTVKERGKIYMGNHPDSFFSGAQPLWPLCYSSSGFFCVCWQKTWDCAVLGSHTQTQEVCLSQWQGREGCQPPGAVREEEFFLGSSGLQNSNSDSKQLLCPHPASSESLKKPQRLQLGESSLKVDDLISPGKEEELLSFWVLAFLSGPCSGLEKLHAYQGRSNSGSPLPAGLVLTKL